MRGFGALGEEVGGYILEGRKGGHFDRWFADSEQITGKMVRHRELSWFEKRWRMMVDGWWFKRADAGVVDKAPTTNKKLRHSDKADSVTTQSTWKKCL